VRTNVGPKQTPSNLRTEPGRSELIATRKEIERGWRATSDILLAQGHPELTARIHRFLDQIPPKKGLRGYLGPPS